MQNGHAAGRRLRLRGGAQAHHVLANLGWIDTVVAAVQGGDKLGKDAPNECLLCILVLGVQVSNDASQITVAAVLHVDV